MKYILLPLVFFFIVNPATAGNGNGTIGEPFGRFEAGGSLDYIPPDVDELLSETFQSVPHTRFLETLNDYSETNRERVHIYLPERITLEQMYEHYMLQIHNLNFSIAPLEPEALLIAIEEKFSGDQVEFLTTHDELREHAPVINELIEKFQDPNSSKNEGPGLR